MNGLHDRDGSGGKGTEGSFGRVRTAEAAPAAVERVTSVQDWKCETVEVSTLCRTFDGLGR